MKIKEILGAAEILRAARKVLPVAYLPLGETEMLRGTARRIVGSDGGYTPQTAEFNDKFLRVTGLDGVEQDWPVKDLIDAYCNMRFGIVRYANDSILKAHSNEKGQTWLSCHPMEAT